MVDDEAADHAAIIDLALAYGRNIDAADFDAAANLFTADATAELSGSGQRGRDEIRSRLAMLRRFRRWEHHIGDHEVTVAGDTATARHSVTAHHIRPGTPEPPPYTIVGTYEDRLVRTEAGWRLSHRSLVVTHREG